MKDGRWTVRRSTYSIQTPWLSLRADDCTTGRGVDVSPYYVLEFSDFVHVLATWGDEVVLVRQYRHGAGTMTLELPGGVMEFGERDAIAVAARELREETGFGGGDWSYLMPMSIDPARYANKVHFVRAEGVAPGPVNPEPTEDIEIVLVSRAEAVGMAKRGEIFNAAHAAILLIGLT